MVLANSNPIDHVIFDRFFNDYDWVIDKISDITSNKKKYLLADATYDTKNCRKKVNNMGYKLLAPINLKNTKNPIKIRKETDDMNKREMGIYI